MMKRLHTIDELLTLELEHSAPTEQNEQRFKRVESLLSAASPEPLGALGLPPQLEDSPLQGTPMYPYEHPYAHEPAKEHIMSDRENDRNTFKDLAKLAGAPKQVEANSEDDGVIDFAALAAAAAPPPPPPSVPASAVSIPPAVSSAPSSARLPQPVGASELTSAPASSAPSAVAIANVLPPVERAPRVSQPPAAAPPAPVESVPAPRGAERKKSPMLPVAFAIGAVAAAVAFVAMKSSSDQKVASNVTNKTAQGAAPQLGEPVKARAVAAPDLPTEPEAVAKPATTASAKVAPLASADKKPEEKPEEKKPEEVKTEPPVASVAPPATANPGDPASLEEQIRRAAGGNAKTDPGAGAAAGPDTTGLPTKPSQGAVRGAVGTVLGAARACVTADDPVAHATITFGSSGGVQGVSVSGGGGKDGCIRGALSRARVAPFSQPSFSTSVTVRGD